MRLSLTSLSLLLTTTVTSVTARDLTNARHLSRRATTKCPAGGIVGQWWEAYTSQTSSQINWNGGTNFITYFTTLTTETGISANGASDASIKAFVTAAHAKKAKALYTIGGWSGSAHFSTLIATPTSRTSFAKAVVAFMNKYSFDGADFDWEYPAQVGAGNAYSPDDAVHFALFFRELRSQLAKGKLVTISVNMSGFKGANGQKLADNSFFAKYVDYVIVMGYDVVAAGWANGVSGPNAPLTTCKSTTPTIQAGIDYWVKSGVPACQVILGLPAFSHSFTLASSTLTATSYTLNGKTVSSKLFQKLATTAPVDPVYSYTNLISKGYLSSDATTGKNGFTRIWDTCTSTPFLFRASDKTLISYDDATSIKLKAQYARTRGLAGVMFFASSGTTTDLLTAAKSGFSS
ncbi:hypothetical protein T439DRAFT_115128 [Meredithblackwellia eburnea MCA 4105]